MFYCINHLLRNKLLKWRILRSYGLHHVIIKPNIIVLHVHVSYSTMSLEGRVCFVPFFPKITCKLLNMYLFTDRLKTDHVHVLLCMCPFLKELNHDMFLYWWLFNVVYTLISPKCQWTMPDWTGRASPFSNLSVKCLSFIFFYLCIKFNTISNFNCKMCKKNH